MLVRPRPRATGSIRPSTDPARVLDDPSVAIVVEVMGGVEPTLGYLRARWRGLGRDGEQAAAVATRARAAAGGGGGRRRAAKTSACAAIPVIKVLRESLLAAEIEAVTGIVNGTTNYILTEMARGEAPTPRRSRGPRRSATPRRTRPRTSAPGADAAAKMAILASIAFHSRVLIDDVPFEGIDGLQAEDLAHADALGFVVKLVEVARLLNGSVSVRVYPALLPRGHRLAAIGGPDNAVLIESRATREIMLVGPAPAATRPPRPCWPTSCRCSGPTRARSCNALADAGRPIAPPGSVPSAFYLHTSVVDRPGVPAVSRRLDLRRRAPVDPVGRPERLRRRGQPGAHPARGLEDSMQRAVAAHRRPRRRARRARDAGCWARARAATGDRPALIERYRDLLPVDGSTQWRVARRGRDAAGAAPPAVRAPRPARAGKPKLEQTRRASRTAA